MSTSDVDRDRYMRLTLFVRVDAANVAFQMLATLEALIASGDLALVSSDVLCRTEHPIRKAIQHEAGHAARVN